MGLGMIKKSSLCSAKLGQEDGILHRTTGSRWQARPARKDKTAFSKLIERRPQLVPELLAEARVDDNVDGGVEDEAEVPNLDGDEEPEWRFFHSLGRNTYAHVKLKGQILKGSTDI